MKKQKTKSKKEYQAHKLGAYTRMLMGMFKANPKMAEPENWEYLKKDILYEMPEIGKAHECPICQSSMLAYVFRFDYHTAVLLIKMAEAVKNRKEVTGNFTLANQVQIHSINDINYTTKSRTTQTAKLGLIAKLIGKNGKQVPGTWVITERGFEALQGKPVPSSIKVFRNKIIERFEDDVITINQALKSYDSARNEAVRANRKQDKIDYRDIVQTYSAQDWVNIEYIEPKHLY